MVICIDFDGTCVTHEFPKVGKPIDRAVETLRELANNGHQLILYTIRSDRPELAPTGDPDIEDVAGRFLGDAVEWFKENDIPLYGIQRNPTQGWTLSPKAYANLYIDDAALGCPLQHDREYCDRPYVDWNKVRSLLYDMFLIEKI